MVPIKAPRIIAEFVPQRWEGDTAMLVEPPSDPNFDVTDLVLAMGEIAARKLRDDQTETDELRWADTAPAWVKDWDGPFYISVELSIGDYYDALKRSDSTPQATKESSHE